MLRAMTARSHVGFAVIAIAFGPLLACRRAEDPPHTPSPPAQTQTQARTPALQTQKTTPSTSSEPDFDWSPHRGRCVLAKGYVSGSKLGPLLQSGTFSIAVKMKDPPGDEAWSRLPGGSLVRVQGIVTERSDLPVFVPKEGKPIMQGTPVPEGTDLAKARRRYLIEEASATLLRTVARARAELKAAVGNDVSLNGVIWSLNGHWWFTHDGIDIHVERQDNIPEWTSKHGRPATLHGRLERRALPRIDQIALKLNRDLANNFLLSLTRMTPHPAWAVTSCPSPK